MDPQHPDYSELRRIADKIVEQAGGATRLREDFPLAVREVIDSIVDPVRTGRTEFEELVNVEKTFIGLRLEHVLRDMIDAPSGLRDLVIDGMDVDVKNTVRTTWTIPPETYRDEEPCILVRSNEAKLLCWLGVIFARDAYLTPGKNRDAKRSISAAGRKNVLWLLEAVPYPKTYWEGVDTERFRELRRTVKGGTKRAAAFFRDHVGVRVHRSVVRALLHDQHDYMKRLRGNGGARDLLKVEGIALLTGTYDAPLLAQLGYGSVLPDEALAVRPTTVEQAALLRAAGVID